MPAYVDTFNHLLAIGTIVLQVLLVVLVASLLFFRSPKNPILEFFKRYTFVFGFLISLGSILLSLFYSEVIGFPACQLCLVQRVFLYPQALMLGYLLWRPRSTKTRSLVETSMISASFGAIVSLFHLYVENGGATSVACATGGPGVVSCATRYVFEFGYITIPVMALTASLMILTLLLNYRYMTRFQS